MGLRLGQPTKAGVAAIAATLGRGRQKAVGGGVYLRVDSVGRLRYQLRIRDAGGRQRGRTYDTWAEADAERRRLAEVKRHCVGGSRGALPRMSIEDYAWHIWWPFLGMYAEPVTQRDYERVLRRDVLPYWRGRRLSDVGVNEVEAFARHLAATKRIETGARRGEVPVAACRRAVDILGRIFGDAVERGVVEHDPVAAYRRMERRRSKLRPPSHRPVRRRFVQHPLTVERIRAAINGRPPWQRRGRAIVSLMAWQGLRPNEIVALTHGSWRDVLGARSHIYVCSGVKDVGGHLVERQTKTHRDREVELWPAVAKELEELYTGQGQPNLTALVFPSRAGGFMRWDNWRDRTWYPALHRAGISSLPLASAEGAFDPYSLRHTYATLMFHVVTKSGRRYAPTEIARQLGCSIETLFRVYAEIIDDPIELAESTMDELIRAARTTGWDVDSGSKVNPADSSYYRELSLGSHSSRT